MDQIHGDKIINTIHNATLSEIRKVDHAMLFTFPEPDTMGFTSAWLTGWQRPSNVKVGDKGKLELRKGPGYLMYFFVKENI